MNFQEFWNDVAPILLAALPPTIVIVIGAIVLRVVISRLLYLIGDRTNLTRELVTPVVRITRTFIAVAAIILVLGVLGFNLGGLWAVLVTVLGMIAIGIVAVWSLLSNTSSTILILLLRPFQVGDDIEFAGDPVRGRVVDLNFFFTTLLDEDGRLVQIPNNLFFQKTLKRRRNETRISLAFQLNSPTPAALPPPPPSPAKPTESKSAEPNPLMSLPDPASMTPPQHRPGK